MDFFVNTQTWQIYVWIGLALCLLEIFVPSFFLLPVGLGFLLASIFVEWTDSLSSQLLILAACELVVVGLFFKFIRPRFKKDHFKSNADSMIGKEVVVSETIEGQTGYVKLFGDEWRAVSKTSESIAVGARVKILKIDGNKVIVEKIEAK